MPAPILTADALRAMIHYDPDTGVFTWKARPDARKAWNTRYAGKSAGYDWQIGNTAYRSIRIFDWPFLGHRLAWLYMTGEWPESMVDHADTNGLNNRWSNLRPATKSQNSANSRKPVTNKTGFKGVSVAKKSGKYRATITVNGRHKDLGIHSTPEAAHDAYCDAAAAYSGEYARAS